MSDLDPADLIAAVLDGTATDAQRRRVDDDPTLAAQRDATMAAIDALAAPPALPPLDVQRAAVAAALGAFDQAVADSDLDDAARPDDDPDVDDPESGLADTAPMGRPTASVPTAADAHHAGPARAGDRAQHGAAHGTETQADQADRGDRALQTTTRDPSGLAPVTELAARRRHRGAWAAAAAAAAIVVGFVALQGDDRADVAAPEEQPAEASTALSATADAAERNDSASALARPAPAVDPVHPVTATVDALVADLTERHAVAPPTSGRDGTEQDGPARATAPDGGLGDEVDTAPEGTESTVSCPLPTPVEISGWATVDGDAVQWWIEPAQPPAERALTVVDASCAPVHHGEL